MGLAIGTLAACALPLFVTASFALAIQRDLSLTTSQIGVAIAAFWVVATLGALPSGRLVDRIGPARGVHAAGASVGLASLAIAAFADSFALFVVLLALTGLGNALVKPAMSVLIKRGLRPGLRGTTFGLQQSGPPLASIVAGAALPAAGAALGWRGVFAVGGLLAVAATAIVRDRDAPAEATDEAAARPAAGADGPAEAGGAVAAVSEATVSERAGSSPGLLLLGGTLASCAANGLIAYLVVFSVDSGLSSAAAGWLLTAAGAACVLTRVTLGVMADRGRRSRLPEMAVLMLISVPGFALLAIDAPWTTVAGCLLALGVGWGWAGLYVLTAVEQSRDAPGRSVGAAATGTFAGAIVGPLAVGLLADTASFGVAWMACAALCLLAAAAFVGARRRQEGATHVHAGR